MLSIYSTLTREQRPFESLEPGRVRMYVCGVTVYDYCHIGHGRTFVAFDVVRRWLEASGYKVTFVRNITDVDDKIIRRAAERGVTTDELTDEFARAMQEDMLALGCLAPTFEPRATQYIPQMLNLIGKLEEQGFAYHAADGDVDYAVRKFPNYGRLSGKSIDDLQSGARVQEREGKHDPLDFVLWKSAKPGEPQWDSKVGCGARDGISNAQPWRWISLAKPLISTAAARIWCSRITRMKLPKAKRRRAISSRALGCIRGRCACVRPTAKKKR